MSVDDELPGGGALDLFGEAANGLVSKTVEALILLQAGDPVLAATIGGGAGGATKGILDGGRRLWARRRHRAARFLDAARREAQEVTAEQLFERATNHDDERRLDLLVKALRAAVEDGQKDLVEFYGRIAASGILAEDDARVDEATRVFSTLAAMDLLELKTLLLLTDSEQPQDWYISGGDLPSASERGNLLQAMPQLENVVDSVVAGLDGAGLISTRTQAGPNFGGPDFRVTGYARTCRAELDRGAAAGT